MMCDIWMYSNFNIVAQILIDTGEKGDGPLLHNAIGRYQPRRYILDQPFPLFRFHYPIIQKLGLGEIVILPAVDPLGVFVQGQDGLQSTGPYVVVRSVEAVGVIVGSASLALDGRLAVSGVGADAEGRVHLQLEVVGPQAVAMGVPIIEQATLEHPIGGWFYAYRRNGR